MKSKKDWLDGHWWRPDATGPAMVNRTSGEAIVYRGPTDGQNWHLFEYRHGSTSYSLPVQFKSIAYPHPNPERFERGVRQFSFPDIVHAHAWIVDHGRLMERAGSGQFTEYSVWAAADTAIREAALLWDTSLLPVQRADEMYVKQGYLNGAWREKLYRRYWWSEIIENYEAGVVDLGAIKQFPSSAAGSPSARKMPKWYCVPGLILDNYGTPTPGESIGLVNRANGAKLGTAPDSLKRQAPPTTATLVYNNEGYTVSHSIVSFSEARVSWLEIDRFQRPSTARWSAPVWKVSVHNYLGISPSKVEEFLRSNGVDVSESRTDPEESAAALALRYRNALLQIDAFEHALPRCPSFDDKSCEPDDEHHPNRQIDIDLYPIGGKFAGRASVRVDINPTEDAPISAWVQSFNELE